MRISVSAGTQGVSLPHMVIRGPLESIFETASRLSVDGVDLFLSEVAEADASELSRLSEAHSVDIVLISPLADLIEASITMTSPDHALADDYMCRAPRHLELAAAVGAIVPIGFTRGRRTHNDVPVPDYDTRLMEALVRYDALAQEFGIQLAIEPINRYEIDSVNTVQDAVRLVRDCDLKNTGILADLFHMNIEEVSIVEALRSAADLLTHVHISDSNRRAPGAGHLNLLPVVRTLKRADYDGFLGIEAILGDASEDAIRASVGYVRALGDVVHVKST